MHKMAYHDREDNFEANLQRSEVQRQEGGCHIQTENFRQQFDHTRSIMQDERPPKSAPARGGTCGRYLLRRKAV